MKKLFLIFSVLALTFSSCGEDDGGGGGDTSGGSDPLVGTWKLISGSINGNLVVLDACQKMETIIVSSNGTFTSESFDDNGSGGCDSDGIDNGRWENVGGGSYKITSEIGTPDEDEFTAPFTFSGNTFSVTVMDDGDTVVQVFQKQ
ncbi:lipocalin-like domain-containing protein [Hyunsoonleella rubra]|uniref:Lipocalin family protein n=1 Tax=Hyunsoonleella rubra TaxID=1737062 RepID=A0ABW5TC95_9FLAO